MDKKKRGVLWIFRNQGQSLIEYTTLIIIVLAVFLTIGNYFKRGIQGRWKSAVDDLGDQYDPRTANTFITQSLASTTNTIIQSTQLTGGKGSVTERIDQSSTTERKIGNANAGTY